MAEEWCSEVVVVRLEWWWMILACDRNVRGMTRFFGSASFGAAWSIKSKYGVTVSRYGDWSGKRVESSEVGPISAIGLIQSPR